MTEDAKTLAHRLVQSLAPRGSSVSETPLLEVAGGVVDLVQKCDCVHDSRLDAIDLRPVSFLASDVSFSALSGQETVHWSIAKRVGLRSD